MLPVTVTSLKNVSPLAVVTPFRRAAGRCACRPDASFFSVRHAVVKVPPVRNDVLSVIFSISPYALYAYERISFLLFVGEVVFAVPSSRWMADRRPANASHNRAARYTSP